VIVEERTGSKSLGRRWRRQMISGTSRTVVLQLVQFAVRRRRIAHGALPSKVLSAGPVRPDARGDGYAGRTHAIYNNNNYTQNYRTHDGGRRILYAVYGIRYTICVLRCFGRSRERATAQKSDTRISPKIERTHSCCRV